jgi:hypothetical protein
MALKFVKRAGPAKPKVAFCIPRKSLPWPARAEDRSRRLRHRPVWRTGPRKREAAAQARKP